MGREQPSRREPDVAGTGDHAASGAGLSPDVLAGVRRREPDALGALFDAYVDRIYGLALRLLRDRAAAEDVTQEAFLRVHRSCHQLDPTRDPGPWLLTITANLCRERWRRSRRRGEDRTLSLDDDEAPGAFLAAAVVDPAPDPAAAAEATQRQRRLEEAIGHLPENMRLVVLLHAHQGLTHEEIAALVDENPAAVRKRFSRALRRLRELLQDVQE